MEIKSLPQRRAICIVLLILLLILAGMSKLAAQSFGCNRETLSFNFETSTMEGWTNIDADNDGFTWTLFSTWWTLNVSSVMGTGHCHNGSTDCVLSQSYCNGYGVLNPDNYLVSPQINLGGTFSFYACAQDAYYAAEHFGVAVSTTGNTSASAFTMLQEWTMTAKDKGVPIEVTRDGSRDQGKWYYYTVDLSAYAGQTGYVAIRHFNCSDKFCLDVDDVTLVCPPDNYSVSLINAIPNPAGGGTVSGNGFYQQGTACTLTATSSAGFTFVNWTENGQEISTTAQYTFSVTGQRWLEANFSKPGNITFADTNVKALCVANWDTNNDGELSYNEAAAVTSLDGVFKDKTNITSFAELQYFTGLSTVKCNSFSGCTSLTSITLPNTLTGIGSNAFDNCTALTSVYYTGTIAQWCDIHFVNGTANPLNYASFFYVNNTLIRNLTIPNTVTKIGNHAFYHYRSLNSVTIPSSVTTIGSYAFYNCPGLTGGLSLPSSLTSVGNYAFYGCTGLTGDLTLPNSVTRVGNYAFYGCTGFNGSLALSNTLTSVGDYAFNGCTGFTGNLTLSNTLESIGSYAFSGCTGFTGNLTLPNSLNSLGEYAFRNCSGFNGSLALSNSLETINVGTFSGCTGFTGVLTIPNRVTTIPNTSSSSYDGAFYNCDGFTSLVIPNTMTNIGNCTFCDCDGLTSVTIGTSVSRIGSGAFISCNNLGEVNFNATNCGSGYLFQDCSNLRTLTIGENVVTLPDYAFTYSYDLERIISGATIPPLITSTVFPSSISDIPVYVPCSAQAAYQADPIWDNFTNYQSSAYLLTVTPEDETMGYVSIEQYGTCDNPTSIVKADPKLHYGFSCWLKDGVSVSADRIYTFDLEENTHLVARFVSNENITPHWVPNSDPYEDYMSVIAVVQIDGVEQASTTLELGAFCGEECRGSVIASYFPPTQRYIYQLPVYGNPNDVITFRLFEHNTQTELNLTSETTLTYIDNGYGSLSNPQALNFVSMVAITASVTPTGAGTVTGAGNYLPGTTATLTATANEGYAFSQWKEGSTVVSTEATYSFTVTGARSLYKTEHIHPV